MGENIKHPALKKELQIGRNRGTEGIDAYYPTWIFKQFLTSGYEPKETIQTFLDNAENVRWYDFKLWRTSPLLIVELEGGEYEKKDEFIAYMVEEGYLILLQTQLDDPSTAKLYTTEYGKSLIEDVARNMNITIVLYPSTLANEGEIR